MPGEEQAETSAKRKKSEKQSKVQNRDKSAEKIKTKVSGLSKGHRVPGTQPQRSQGGVKTMVPQFHTTIPAQHKLYKIRNPQSKYT